MEKTHLDQGFLKYELCEEFADHFCLPTDYVWLEFVDPNFATTEEVQAILSNY